MSGSGSTIFCVGSPDAESAGSWQDEIRTKYDVDIFDEGFCARPADEQRWYAEA